MNKIFYEISDYCLIYSVILSSLVLSQAIPSGTFTTTVNGSHFLVALIGAALLYGYKKYSRSKARQPVDLPHD